MEKIISREIQLKRRPVGELSKDDFAFAKTEIQGVNPGEVLVKNIYMSVDPYMRGRMIDRDSYVPPFPLNTALEGHSIGEVVASENKEFSKGDYVMSLNGWREYYLSDGTGLTKVAPGKAPLRSFLSVLGVTGLTAWAGLVLTGQPKEGQTILVSAASGAVGSMVCQIAKIKGCRVIGSVGSDKKLEWLLNEIGIDAGFNYKKVGPLKDEVARLAPEGLDFYFENVGGEHYEAALENMKNHGQILQCGMISIVNATEPVPGPSNIDIVHRKRLTIKGFNVVDFFDKLPVFYADMGKWISEGRIKWKETIAHGIDNAPEALMGLYKGKNFGKMLVQLAPDTSE